jgi:hypothetical protein
LAAATQKDYRFLHAGKEIRLNNEVHGTHVASEASSPLVQELGGPVSLRCEAWRCEFAEGSKNCDSAAEQGRRYCLAHLASKPQ